MADRERQLEVFARMRASRIELPDEHSEHWDDWIALVDLDGLVAGILSSSLGGGLRDSPDVESWRGLIASNPKWAQLWPEEVKVLEAACDALSELDLRRET